ncbi:MAG TPA: nuclear transport factor 2 family protein [Rudaea sp.]|jgi:ketosteroid isomerase-like protein
MKLAIVLALVVAMAACGGFARATSGDEQEIRRVEALLCKAFESGDAATLRRYMDAAFTQTSSRGEVTDFAQNVAEVAKREPRYEVFRNHEQKVRLYGDSAIILGITTVKGTSEGKPFEADFQYTDTWIHRDGHWKIAASHASRLAR